MAIKRLFSLRNHIWSVLEQKDHTLMYSWSVTGLQQPHVTLPYFWASTDKNTVHGNSNYQVFSLVSSSSASLNTSTWNKVYFFIFKDILRVIERDEESCRLTPGLHTKLEMQYQPRWLQNWGTDFLRDHSNTEIVLWHLIAQYKQS